MIKDLFNIIFNPNPEEIQQFDNTPLDLSYYTKADLELAFEELVYIEPRLISVADFKYLNFDIDKWFKAILRRMLRLLYGNICSVKIDAYSLTITILLLFGLCSSQSSTIFSAYFGTSLSRIPSL